MMASTTLLKDTGSIGILPLLLLGILLPSVLVSGQTDSTTPITSISSTTASTTIITTTAPTTTNTAIQPSSTMISSSTTGSTTNSISGTTAGSTTQPTATSGITAMTTTQSATSTTSGAGLTTMTQSSSTTTASGMTSSSSSMTAGTGSSTSMMSNSTDGISGMNGTTSMIYCPSFSCNYSDCYTMYTSQNATSCTAGAYCQLKRQMDMWYTVSCSASCADSCANASQTNCSVNCCNSTGCLNGSFASMMMSTSTVTTTTTTTTTTTPTTTATSTNPQTTSNNGKKCHQGTCTGATCYTNFGTAPLQTCSSSQPHCQLKKETVNSNLQWTAGCTTNCSGETVCKASTQPPCHLECCNATMTSSCLWLNGTMNVPSFATRGPHLNTEVIASLLCLLAISLLL